MASNYGIFIEGMFDIGGMDSINLYFAYHIEFDLMYFVKENKLLDCIGTYIDTKQYIHDMNCDKYHLILMVLFTNEIEFDYIVKFYLKHKVDIAKNMKEINAKKGKSKIDTHLLKKYDQFIAKLF